ncbi:MAG: radical SAM protein [Candidatus Lokiarchaeota archaeon]|nr:radical SAM protein [Candidatus Lokiarchaeota archaeon]
MRILLITPDNPTSDRIGILPNLIFPPLGLEYLAAYIKDIASVYMLDERLKSVTLKTIEYQIKIHKPDYVGISCNYSFQINRAIKIASIAKSYGCKTVLGGWHPSLAVDDTLKSPFVDIVVKAEGEITFRELIKNNNPIGVQGLSYKNNGNIVHNPDRDLMDLKDIQLPAREYRSPEAKKTYNYFGFSVDSIETSRGCPYDCNFCCIHHFYRSTYRQRSIDDIIRELKTKEIKNHASIVYVVDDNFVVNKKYTMKLCEAIIRERINKYFMAQARVDMIVNHPEIFKKMADAGFVFLFLGIESFSDRTLKKMNKRTEFEQIKQSIKILHDMGYIIQGNIIIGADLEDKEQDLQSTIDIANSLDIDLPTFSLLTSFPGTQLMKQVLQEDRLLTKDWRYFSWSAPTIRYDHLSSDMLCTYLERAYHEVNFNPKDAFKRLIIKRGLPFHAPRFYSRSMINGIPLMIKTLTKTISNKLNNN